MKRKDDKYLTPLKTIGGTDANMIAQGKLYEVWINKLHPEKQPDLSGIFQVNLGVETEPFNREWFMEQTEKRVVMPEKTFYRKDIPFGHCRPDGIIKNDNKYGDSILECKHTNAFNDIKKVTERYYYQIQWNMWITKTALCYMSVIFGNKWDYWEVEPDVDKTTDLVIKVEDFWNKYIIPRIEPPR